jgi:hypothetical protein
MDLRVVSTAVRLSGAGGIAAMYLLAESHLRDPHVPRVRHATLNPTAARRTPAAWHELFAAKHGARAWPASTRQPREGRLPTYGTRSSSTTIRSCACADTAARPWCAPTAAPRRWASSRTSCRSNRRCGCSPGRYGTTGFLVGMAQLRHAAGGVWQEWYAKLDGGQWAWLSEAQGRLYLTFERPDVPAPAIGSLAPGAQIQLAGATFTVAERGTATYVSALGEIPYRLVPNSTFQFVDLSDGRGGFATIDYGDGSEPPAVYLGSQVSPHSLGLSGGEAQAQAAPATGARLSCPSCNGSLELRAPDQTLRVACPYCNSLVSVEGGALSIIAQQAKKPRPAIALGRRQLPRAR